MSWEYELVPETGQFAEEALQEIRTRLQTMPSLPFNQNLFGIFVDTTTRDRIADGIRQGLYASGSYIPHAAFVHLMADRLILEMTGTWADEFLSDIVLWCQQRWPAVLVNSTGERVTAEVFRKLGRPT
jgi:hypothetical protein